MTSIRTRAGVNPSAATQPAAPVETHASPPASNAGGTDAPALGAPPTPRAESSGMGRGNTVSGASSAWSTRMSEVGSSRMTAPAQLDAAQLANVVTRKATCPFIGSAVAQGALPVRNNADTPLASVDDVVALGNTGGGNLGEVLKLFARGNHSRMPGSTENGAAPLTPHGAFSLDFPGSQGSHPGHSGILQGDPRARDSGRLSGADMDRLLSRARDGYLTLDDIGSFIAENVKKDPGAKVLGRGVVAPLLGDVGAVVVQAGPALAEHAHNLVSSHDTHDAGTRLNEKVTRTLGEDNLLGSAGEFGLLVALLQHSPHSRVKDGEVSIRAEDVRSMFVDKKLPEGWETWPKTRNDWVAATTKLAASAALHYHRGNG